MGLALAVYSLGGEVPRRKRTTIPPSALGLLEARADDPIADLESTFEISEPDGCLQCRRCSRRVEPTQAPETVLYRYRFDESRRDWLYTQLAARGAVGDVLAGRGFETAWDETVVGASGIEYLLDLYATDAERGLAVIAAVAESPTAEDVIDLHATSIDTDAYPIVIATGESPDGVTADLAEHVGVGLLIPTEPCEPAVSCNTSNPLTRIPH